MKLTFTSAVVKVPAKVGECTCVGTIGWDDLTKPVPWGNRFRFGGAPYPSCVNMVAENLEKLVKNGTLVDGAVQVKLYQDLTEKNVYYAIVIDDRIPSKEWLRELRFSTDNPNQDIVDDMKKTLKGWEEKRFAKASFSVPDWCNFWEGRGAKVVQLLSGNIIAIPHELDDASVWKPEMMKLVPDWAVYRVLVLLDKMVCLLPFQAAPPRLVGMGEKEMFDLLTAEIASREDN